MDTIQHILTTRAEQTPELEALVAGGKRYTFQEYNERARKLAHYLLTADVQKGDRIAILGKNNHTFPTIIQAAIKIGAIAVPLNTHLTSYELDGIILNSKPKVFFYDDEFSNTVNASENTSMITNIIKTCIGMETTAEFDNLFAGQPITDPTVAAEPEDPAAILFTSGTTGNPKGCIIGHHQVASYFNQMENLSFRQSGGRYLAVHPLFHMSGFLNILNAIHYGLTIVCLPDQDPAKIWAIINEEKITTMMAFPSLYTYMMEEFKQNNWEAPSLKSVSAGGTPVPEQLIKQYADAGIMMGQGFGSTEAWGVSYWHPQMGFEKVSSAGKPFNHVEVKIVDPESGDELQAGTIGEIIIKSPFLFRGYWNNPSATDSVLINGWYHIGDAGYLDEDGYLYITGRYKDMIVCGGDNIYPDQVEEVIYECDGVLEAAVIGIPDDFWGEVPRAYIVQSADGCLTDKDIIQHCQKKIADYKVPEIVFVDQLPKNSLGKILKRDLRKEAVG
ncbi:acyl-CoA synthetase (AMP-forming)/AMP-acid ligase II [Scopulibacillus darangshiensis]|uniref:Acyl-CoA synthetase (AMP-forming)/AMP-acid ligase II n=1 Tax=Scopulibacillus darangshiensis TaxID=442528 RepID=A0A4V6NQN7_9BACL|nr:class I adenylate-forming enzyme family protein [Scopulibacillus darangshiensis]TCP29266.1 acyl-CoA synthetase (AMP-forming)/AMP-acid ligase II [Scopulibacillus darangshiensis]